MPAYNNEITLDGNAIFVKNLNPVRVPGTIKQIIGRDIVEHKIPHRQVFDWNLEMNCSLSGINRETIRDNLYTIQENVIPVAYADGKHDGNYLIKELEFYDEGQYYSVINFRMLLIEVNQET